MNVFRRPALSVILFFGSFVQGYAVDVKLAWDYINNPITPAVGFIVKYGTSPGVYSTAIIVPYPDTTQTTVIYTVIGLAGTGPYFFVVTATDEHQNQSIPTNEVCYGCVTGVAPATNLRIIPEDACEDNQCGETK